MGNKPGAKPPPRKHSSHAIGVPVGDLLAPKEGNEGLDREVKISDVVHGIVKNFKEDRLWRLRYEAGKAVYDFEKAKHDDVFAFMIRTGVGPGSKAPLRKALRDVGLKIVKEIPKWDTSKAIYVIRPLGSPSTGPDALRPVKDDPEVPHLGEIPDEVLAEWGTYENAVQKD